MHAREGNRAEALRAHESARAILTLAAAGHTDLNWLHGELAASLEKIGLLEAAGGTTGTALERCEQALSIRQKLAASHPNLAYWKGEASGSHAALGAVQRRAGRPTDAATSFRRAIALIQELPSLSPRNQHTLACCHAQLAALAAEAGSGLTPAEGAAEADFGMDALRRAYNEGFGVARLRDAALDPLRSRPDFEALVKETEAKASRGPETAPPPRAK